MECTGITDTLLRTWFVANGYTILIIKYKIKFQIDIVLNNMIERYAYIGKEEWWSKQLRLKPWVHSYFHYSLVRDF